MGCFSCNLYRLFLTPHSFSVTIFTLGFRLFFILLQINQPKKSSRRCPPRSPTKHDIPTISLQLDSPDCAQELFKHILISSYLGGQRIEFQCCLRIRFVSIGVVCFHSVGPGCSWISSVITFVDHRGSTIFVSMYILFA